MYGHYMTYVGKIIYLSGISIAECSISVVITVPVTAIITAIITIIIMYLLRIKHNKQSWVPPETDAIHISSLTSPEISNNASYGLQVQCNTPTQINRTTVPNALYDEPTYYI